MNVKVFHGIDKNTVKQLSFRVREAWDWRFQDSAFKLVLIWAFSSYLLTEARSRALVVSLIHELYVRNESLSYLTLGCLNSVDPIWSDWFDL